MKCALRAVAIVVPLSLAVIVSAGQSPNTAKGFNPNGVYQVNGIDSVSAFNGNLTLTIPIGHVYPLGGGLTYQLRLHANGNLWESEERYDLEDEIPSNDCSKPPHTEQVPCVQAYPDRRANAGIGWTLSLGRLFPAWEQTNEQGAWVYESPDGSEHRFYPDMHPSFPDNDANTFYTRDGTYLRMKVNGNRRRIEFPSGEVHTFMPADGAAPGPGEGYVLAPWILETIGSQFEPESLYFQWSALGVQLFDGFRVQNIYYVVLPFESGIEDMLTLPDPPLINERKLVQYVDVAAFDANRGPSDPPPSVPVVGRYTFNYTETDLARPDWHTIPTAYAPISAKAQVLSSLVLPDGTAFTFNYLVAGHTGKSGLPYRMTLPTGGKVEWEWDYYQFPVWTGELPTHLRPPGIIERRVYDRGNVLTGTWTYTSALDGHFMAEPAPRELQATIEDPLGNKTVSYFDVSNLEMGSAGYGLPYTPKTTDSSGARYLAQTFLPAGASTAARSTFVRYETDAGTERFNARMASTRTVYHDDAGAFLDSDSTDYDGLGHYRTVTTKGTGVPVRVTTTNYNPLRGTYPGTFTIPPVSGPWLLGTFSSRMVEEGSKTFKSEHYFDPLTGFLRRTRVMKDSVSGAQGGNDLLTEFTPDARGNVIREELFGGDAASVLTSGDLQSLELPGAVSRVEHEYTAGTLRLSQPFNGAGFPMGFYTFDADIDANTGLVKRSRDSAGVATDLDYDSMGRTTSAKPAGRAWTKYSYPDFSAGNEIQVRLYPPGSGGSSGDPHLSRQRYFIDGLGRVTLEWQEMPDGIESRRESVYNALGWQMEVSELGTGTSLPRTIFTRDAFGRVLTATTPDGALTTFGYTGVRSTSRTSGISTVGPTAPDSLVTTIEQSDLYGRLIRVTEQSGPTTAASPIGANVVTEYAYDPADRLTNVRMVGSETSQVRVFDYDGRGFLRWESHPEGGMTAYTYDARGLVLTKQQSAANTLFDLYYSYDEAGRLLTIHGRNPFFDSENPNDPDQPAWRPMKTFTYGAENATGDKRKGKLVTAARYNYDPADPWGETYKVSETYQYGDDAGRRTGRRTTITKGSGANESWWDTYREVDLEMSYDALDQPSLIEYPMCVGCGSPANPLRNQSYTYDRGRLKTVSGFVEGAGITYWPNGMWKVMNRSNGMTDSQAVDSSGMARPASFTSASSNACKAPEIVGDPIGGTFSQPNSPVVLSVVLNDAGPFTYVWWSSASENPVGNASSYSASPSSTTDYWVVVTNECKSVTSVAATVSVGECLAPGGSATFTRKGSTVTLEATGSGTEPRSYTWRRTSDNVLVGSGRKVTLPAPSTTTTYTVTIANACAGSPATADVTVTVPLSAVPTGLSAEWNGGPAHAVNVSWAAMSGGGPYQVHRRSGPGGWELIATVTGTSHIDTYVQTGRSYAYRVNKQGSTAVTSAVVATTTHFTQVVSGSLVTASSLAPMLEAVNSVRAAAGWPAVTWVNILSSSDPSPSPAVRILTSHIATCRARMNEALQFLGVPISGYPDPDLQGVPIKAAHINEIMGRAN